MLCEPPKTAQLSQILGLLAFRGNLPRALSETRPVLDHPTKTARLLDELKAAVPFTVGLTPEVVLHLRAKRVAAAVKAEQTVADLSYAGDEGGIVCHLAPSDGGAALFVSLTHVRVPRSQPFAAAALQYQKHRVKNLKKQDQR